MILLEPDLGQEAEVDWGTAQVVLQGQPTTVKLFCMRSGKPFVRLYPCERQQALFDALMQAFAFYGGVFPYLIFDNLTTAVRKVLQGKQRQEQESFTHFRSYYNFQARFCNPGAGHEKGGVEGLVGLARRNFLVPMPHADSLEQINQKLLEHCLAYGSHTLPGREQTIGALFDQEKASLLQPPQKPYDNCQLLRVRVDKYATVRVDKNRYSVPTHLVGHTLQAHCYVDSVEIFAQGRCVARHQRLFSNNRWQLKPDHYLELLQQRPLAFHSARAIRDWKPNWPAPMHQLLARFCHNYGDTAGTKAFIEVLFLFRQFSEHDVHHAIATAVDRGVGASEGVRLLLQPQQESPKPPLEQYATSFQPDIGVYAGLGGL